MENNIFLKNKKDKFNPDVIANLSKKSSERKKNEFQSSKNIYNPITNVIPDNIRNQKDLTLERDLSIDNYNINECSMRSMQCNCIIKVYIENAYGHK